MRSGREPEELARWAEVSALRGSWAPVAVGALRSAPKLLVTEMVGFGEDEISLIECLRGSGVPCRAPQGLRVSDRVSWLARQCEELGVSFADVAVVAQSPVDVGMLLEAGVAYALETAGYDACVVADRVFPRQDRGGLLWALRAVRALTP